MPVGKRKVNGKDAWVIDRRFRRLSDGREERYRRVAEVQTRAAADAEERRVCGYYAQHGNITALLVGEPTVPKTKAKVWTWDDAVEHYKKVVLPQRKPSVRASYGAVLGQPLLRYWAGKSVAEISKASSGNGSCGLARAVPTMARGSSTTSSCARCCGPLGPTRRRDSQVSCWPMSPICAAAPA
jgi:hypothetical protein